ncbi:hypothetical protein, partial [Propionibacterium sp.]|uniref:hypothetical protein n=1 Tax=Propionibacterium sp. TaxID=1977903 RepID=UPI0039ED54FC
MSSTANSDGANQGSDTATRPPRGWRGTWAGIPFIAVLLTILGLGMAGILILNTSIQQQENQLEGLQSQAQAAGYRQALLQGQVDQLSTTDVLAAQAANLGMVPNTNPVIIEMPSGQVVGSPPPAPARALPGVGRPQQVAYPPPDLCIIPEPT